MGLVLVRSFWRAEVELAPWEPRFEIPHRRVVAAAEVWDHLALEGYPARIISRLLSEAGIQAGDGVTRPERDGAAAAEP